MLLIITPVGMGIAFFRGHLIWAAGIALLAVVFFVVYCRVRAKERDRTSGATHEPS